MLMGVAVRSRNFLHMTMIVVMIVEIVVIVMAMSVKVAVIMLVVIMGGGSFVRPFDARLAFPASTDSAHQATSSSLICSSFPPVICN